MGDMPAKISPSFGQYLRELRAEAVPSERSDGVRPSRRQVTGLRRQELAEAAGISVEYYTRLEQGRAAHPSREVLAALARALRLPVEHRDHLFRLAGELPPEPTVPERTIRPGLDRLLRSLGDSVPVTVHDGRLDVLARNAAAVEFLGEVPTTGGYGRNIVYQGFTPSARRVLGAEGVDRYGRWATAELRSAIVRYPDDRHLRGLITELSATSDEFRRHWSRREVAAERSAVKRLRHPTRGWVTFQTEMLHDAERDHWVVIYAPTA